MRVGPLGPSVLLPDIKFIAVIHAVIMGWIHRMRHIFGAYFAVIVWFYRCKLHSRLNCWSLKTALARTRRGYSNGKLADTPQVN